MAVADPLLDDAVTFQNDTHEAAVSDHVRRQFACTVQQAHQTLATDASLRGMDLRAIETAITEIISFLRDNPVTWALLADNDTGDQRFAEQAGNVFYLSMVLGNAVRGYILDAKERPKRRRVSRSRRKPPDLAPLGLAALLQDMSLWTACPDLEHPGPLTPDQRELVYHHPKLSAEMLPEDTNPAVVAAIREHHENHNGTGYPRQFAGREISLVARVLRIADAYSAATSKRPRHPAKSQVATFWEMTCGPYAEFYDPVILKVFQAVVQPYPIGAKVRLACGRYGVVVRYGRLHGLLPELVIAFDEDNKPLPRRLLDGPYRLDQHPEIRITSFHGEDLTGVYGSEAIFDNGSPVPPHSFETMFESCFP